MTENVRLPDLLIVAVKPLPFLCWSKIITCRSPGRSLRMRASLNSILAIRWSPSRPQNVPGTLGPQNHI